MHAVLSNCLIHVGVHFLCDELKLLGCHPLAHAITHLYPPEDSMLPAQPTRVLRQHTGMHCRRSPFRRSAVRRLCVWDWQSLYVASCCCLTAASRQSIADLLEGVQMSASAEGGEVVNSRRAQRRIFEPNTKPLTNCHILYLYKLRVIRCLLSSSKN